MSDKRKITVRLTAEAIELLDDLAEQWGVVRQDMLEITIRRQYDVWNRETNPRRRPKTDHDDEAEPEA